MLLNLPPAAALQSVSAVNWMFLKASEGITTLQCTLQAHSL